MITGSRVSLCATVAVLLLGGCSPLDRPGVEFESGTPRVINCGTWISAVVVSDNETGRTIWSAQATELPDGDRATVARVELGVLPTATWQAAEVLALEPRPSVWRFEIDAAVDDPTIIVRDDDAEDRRVHLPSGESVSAAAYDDKTCTGLPIAPQWITATALVVIALVFAVHMFRRRRHPAAV